MDFEPEKLFIGIVDFFAVIMPGAFLAWLYKASPHAMKPDNEAEGWAMFLFASYLAGHLVFLIGSRLDYLYDWLRKGRTDAALEKVLAIRDYRLKSIGADEPLTMNAFQWSKVRIAARTPKALGAIERLEADSKFFRSFVVALVPVLIGSLGLSTAIPDDFVTRSAAALVMAMSFWRYMERRSKATEHAYRFAIVLEAEEKLLARPALPWPMPGQSPAVPPQTQA